MSKPSERAEALVRAAVDSGYAFGIAKTPTVYAAMDKMVADREAVLRYIASLEHALSLADDLEEAASTLGGMFNSEAERALGETYTDFERALERYKDARKETLP